MNLHVDPIANILSARPRRRYVPQNTPAMRSHLDQAAAKLFAELAAAGAARGTFYLTIGAGELHLYAPRVVMVLAQERGLACDFIVDWHELNSNVAGTPTPRLRSEPASALSPASDAGSPLSEMEA